MKKVTVRISDDQVQKLKKMAKKTQQSTAGCIRDLIDQALQSSQEK